MAKTYAYAICRRPARDLHRHAGAERAAAARPRAGDETRSWCAACSAVYRPVLEFALANRVLTLGAWSSAAGLRRLGGAHARARVPAEAGGRQFLDPRHHADRRSRWRKATATSTACGRSCDSYPEVVTVVSQHGRPDDGTDATGFFNAEFFVPLKPFDTWPAGVDKDSADRGDEREAAGARSPAWISTSRNISRTTSRRRRPA